MIYQATTYTHTRAHTPCAFLESIRWRYACLILALRPHALTWFLQQREKWCRYAILTRTITNKGLHTPLHTNKGLHTPLLSTPQPFCLPKWPIWHFTLASVITFWVQLFMLFLWFTNIVAETCQNHNHHQCLRKDGHNYRNCKIYFIASARHNEAVKC